MNHAVESAIPVVLPCSPFWVWHGLHVLCHGHGLCHKDICNSPRALVQRQKAWERTSTSVATSATTSVLKGGGFSVHISLGRRQPERQLPRSSLHLSPCLSFPQRTTSCKTVPGRASSQLWRPGAFSFSFAFSFFLSCFLSFFGSLGFGQDWACCLIPHDTDRTVSGALCYFCEPPRMRLAALPSWHFPGLRRADQLPQTTYLSYAVLLKTRLVKQATASPSSSAIRSGHLAPIGSRSLSRQKTPGYGKDTTSISVRSGGRMRPRWTDCVCLVRLEAL